MKIIFLLLAIVTMALSGCAQYDNEAMAGAAVDIPDEPPLSEQAPVLTAPSPSPVSNAQQIPGR